MTRRLIPAATALAAVCALAPATASWAATNQTCDAYSQKCPNVQPTKFVTPPAGQGSGTVVPNTVPAPSTSLPFTGADVAVASVIGAVALGAGGALLVVTRRRRRTS